ncbi:MAG: hypothetical protein SVU69_06655 [Pseudomonadota bacterium]|nr:hypothetical protein [Pseudomonadota bacterium]
MASRILPVASPGRELLGAAVIGGAVVYLSLGWIAAFPVILVVLVLCVWFWDPAREIPSAPLGVVSPVDGEILFVEKQGDPFLERESIHIALRPSRLGSYSFRCPVEGKVHELPGIENYPGRCAGVLIRTDEDNQVALVMRGYRFSPRPYVQPFGERAGQGQIWGNTRLISKVDLYLEADARVLAEPGQRVLSGTDLLAHLTHD